MTNAALRVRWGLILSLALLLSGCASASGLPASLSNPAPAPVVVGDNSLARTELNADVFDAAINQVDRLYYDPVKLGEDWLARAAAVRPRALAAPSEAALYRVLDDFLETLGDRHTDAEGPTARRVREARERGETSVAYGVTLVRLRVGAETHYVVDDVRPNSPADAAGIQIGWRLLRVNDLDAGQPLVAAEDRQDQFIFTDEAGTEHVITMSGRRLDSRPPFEATRFDDGVVLLRFNGFQPEARDWMREQVRAFETDPPRAVIIDLRSNGGGRLSVLGDVVGLFFGPRHVFARLKGRWFERPATSPRQRQVWRGPTAVLIGPGSGSASELLAAAFQEADRGLVVGRTSAGAVIASRGYNLPDGGELNVSIQAIFTAQGRLLEHVGVTPDIIVEPTLEDRRARRDVTLERAIEALNLPPEASAQVEIADAA